MKGWVDGLKGSNVGYLTRSGPGARRIFIWALLSYSGKRNGHKTEIVLAEKMIFFFSFSGGVRGPGGAVVPPRFAGGFGGDAAPPDGRRQLKRSPFWLAPE